MDKEEAKRLAKEIVSKHPTFYAYLLKNRIYGRFIKNLTDSLNKGCGEPNELLQCSKYLLIERSFTWSITKEGYEYWRRFHHKFRKDKYEKV